MAAFIGAGLIVQTLYMLVDLYFVAHLGPQAVAGVASGGSASYVVMATSQIVSVGSLALISQAIGRKDDADAEVVFEQSLSLSLALAALALVIGYAVGGAGVSALAADAGTAARARAYFYAFLPALAVMFPSAAMNSGLRASGVVGAPMLVQSASVVLNAVLAPVLIAGWGTGHPLGVAGAGLASTIGSGLGVVVLAVLFNRLQKRLRMRADMLVPRFGVWRRLFMIGAPSTGELLAMFVITAVAYWSIRRFGATAQAGFGIGSRVMMSIFLPAMAVAFAAAPIAGQNFGARAAARVRATFANAALIGTVIMLALTGLCQLDPAVLAQPFTQRPGGGEGGGRLPADQLVQLRGRGAGVRLFGHVPGARRHAAVAGQQRRAAGGVRRAGRVAGGAPGDHAARLLAAVGGLGDGAGDRQPAAAARGDGAQGHAATGCGCLEHFPVQMESFEPDKKGSKSYS